MKRARTGRPAAGILLVVLTLGTSLALWWIAAGVHDGGDSGGAADGLPGTGPVASTPTDPGSGEAADDGKRETSDTLPTNSTTTSPGASDAALPPSALLPDEASDVPLRRLRVHGRVVDEQGQPLASAKVWLLPSYDNRRRLGMTVYLYGTDIPWDCLPHTLSDASGGFELTNVEIARASGDRPEVPTGSPRGTTPTIIVELAGFVPATQTVPGNGWDVSMGDLTLPAAAVVTGRVVDERGEPIPEALLGIPFAGRLDPELAPPWNLARSLAEMHAGIDGRFRIDTLETGTYGLQIHADRKRWAFRDLSTTQGQHLDLGDITLLDGELLGGRLVNEAGEAVAGGTLRAIPSSAPAYSQEDGLDWIMLTLRAIYPNHPGSYQRNVSSDLDGGFLFDDLDPVPHDLFVQADRYDVSAFTRLATGHTDLELVLAPEALLVIRVIDDATDLPAAETSLTAARSIFKSNYPTPMWDSPLRVLSGPEAVERLGLAGNGHGLFVAGPAGFVANGITVSAPGRKTLQLALPGLQAGEVHERQVHLSEQAPDPLSGLEGVTVDGAGDPLPSVELSALPQHVLFVTQKTTTSDAQGRFAFEGMKPGSWHLQAKHAGFLLTKTASLTLEADAPQHDVEVRLERGARIAGTVFALDGTPARLHAVEVRFGEERRPAYSTLTDATGHYSFDAVPPGTLNLRADPGASAQLDVVRGELTLQDLQLQRPPRLSGTVRDAAGHPLIANVVLYPLGITSATSSKTTSDEQGAYLFSELEPMRARLYAVQGSTRSKALEVHLDWSDINERDLVFGGGRLGGWVFRTGSTEGIANVSVKVMLQDDPTDPGSGSRGFSDLTKTDEQGRYDFDRLLHGPYEVRVMRGDWVRKTPTPIHVDIQDTPVDRDLLVEPCAQLIVDVSTLETDLGHKLTLQLTRLDQEDALRTTGIKLQDETTIENTPAGTWSYTVTRSKYSWRVDEGDPIYATGQVQLRSGEVTRESIVLVAPDD